MGTNPDYSGLTTYYKCYGQSPVVMRDLEFVH